MTKQGILFICISFIGISNAAVSVPKDFVASEIRSTSITTTWAMVDDVDYDIAIVVSGGMNRMEPSETGKVTSPHQITKTNSMQDVMPNTRYNIRLFAINPADRTDFKKAKDIGQLWTAPAAPYNVQISEVRSNQFDVTWDFTNNRIGGGPHVATQYIVTYTTDEGPSMTQDVTAKFITITGLTSNTDYTVSVVGWTSDEIFTDDGIPSTQPTTIPSKVNPPTPMDQTTASISLQWEAVEGMSTSLTYDITWNPPSNDGTHNKPGITSTSTIIEGLTPGTQYNFTVSAVNNGGSGLPSELSSLYTVPAQSSKPTLSQPSSNETTSLIVNWNQPTGIAEMYEVTLSIGTSAPSFKETTEETNIVAAGLEPGASYKAVVTAISGELRGAASEESTQGRTNPPTPIDVMLSQPSTGDQTTQLVISWSISSSNYRVASYNIVVKPANGSEVKFTYVTGSNNPSTNYLVNTLIPGESYTATVQAVSPSQGAPATLSKITSSLVAQVTVPAQSSKPTLSQPSSNETTSLIVNWNQPTGIAEMYEVTLSIGTSAPSFKETTEETNIVAAGLEPGASYKAVVTAISGELRGAASEESTQGRTNPPTPIDVMLSQPSTGDQTTQLVISWSISSSNYRVASYNIVVKPANGSEVKFTYVTGSNNPSTNYLVNTLIPGESYTATVQAVSPSQGAPVTLSKITSSLVAQATDPASVKNLTIFQNPTNPDTMLDLTWIKPVGLGNMIKINYESVTTSKSTANKQVDFSTTNTSIIVIPGNNYTVNVTVMSNGLESMTVMEQLNSKPSGFEYTIEPSSNEVKLTWNEPVGYVEGFVIQFDSKDIQLDANTSFHTISNLFPYTSYRIQMYSWITNIDGNLEQSISTPSIFTTWANPPSLSNPQASLNQDATSATTTITFILPAGTYNDADALIEYYAVYITSVTATGTAPNVTRNETCESFTNSEGGECVALWTDSQGNPTTISSRKKKTNVTRTITKANQPITFIIGDSNNTTSPWNIVFTNYPLQPGASYRISVAAKTNNPQMTGMNWSPPIQTGSDAGLIAGLVCAAVVIVLALVGFYFYKKRYIQKEPPGSGPNNYNISLVTTNSPVINTRREDSRIIQIDDFNHYMQRMKEHENRRLIAEFEEMKGVGREQSTDAALIPENYVKNRYKKSILPYDKTRVVLSTIEDDPTSDYINANFIPGYKKKKEFIATEGPLETTSDNFWRMIWEQNSRYIVMLTNTVERDRVKCSHYWPYDSKPVKVAGLTLEMSMEAISEDWTLREFKLTLGSEIRCIKQFHYTSWPDHGVPGTAENLVKFITRFRATVDGDVRAEPITVHCSAGVGRTGTFIAMDRLLQHTKEHSDVDIFGIVYEMRECRMSMVQTDKQYILLHTMVQEAINQVYENYAELPLYENYQPPAPIYENTSIGRELHGSFNQSFI